MISYSRFNPLNWICKISDHGSARSVDGSHTNIPSGVIRSETVPPNILLGDQTTSREGP